MKSKMCYDDRKGDDDNVKINSGSNRCVCVYVSHETVNRFTKTRDHRTKLKREPGQEEGEGGRCWREGETGTKQRRRRRWWSTHTLSAGEKGKGRKKQ